MNSDDSYLNTTKRTCYAKGYKSPSDAEFEYYNDKFTMITFYIVMGIYFFPLIWSIWKFVKTSKKIYWSYNLNFFLVKITNFLWKREICTIYAFVILLLLCKIIFNFFLNFILK